MHLLSHFVDMLSFVRLVDVLVISSVKASDGSVECLFNEFDLLALMVIQHVFGYKLKYIILVGSYSYHYDVSFYVFQLDIFLHICSCF